jgi:hypothetical protein
MAPLVDADGEAITHVEFDLFSREAPQFAVSRSATAPDGVHLGDAKRDRPASRTFTAKIAIGSFAIGVIVGVAIVSRVN